MKKPGHIILRALTVCAVLLVGIAWRCLAGEMKIFSHEITGNQADYVIEVGGTLDPENIELRIENLGDTSVKDPRMTINGLYDWYDVKSIASEITRGLTTDEDKAMAIWEWLLWKRYQRSPTDESAINVVRGQNGYGYGICGHSAAWLKTLCLAVGVKARVYELCGHTVNEAYWDNKWHFLDSNVRVYYLDRDNRTLAGLEELEKDPWLIERTIHPRDPWMRRDDPPGRNAEFVRYIVSAKDNYIDDSYDKWFKTDFNMSFTLNPGMTVIRWWEPKLGKFEGRDKRPLVPKRYSNGQIIWEPDLSKIDMKDYLHILRNITTKWAKGGKGPSIQVDYLQDEQDSCPSRVEIPISSPWPVVGGRFTCTLVKDPGCAVSVFYGTPQWEGPGLYTFRWGNGLETDSFDLDASILQDAPVYHYDLGFTLLGNGRERIPGNAGVDWFRSETDLQVGPYAIPALKLGRNKIHYWSKGGGSQKIRITFTWRERDDNHKPSTVDRALSPKRVKNLSPVLEWKAATDQDSDDCVTDYQVMLSLRPDCRWALSNSTYRNVGSTATQWRVPNSFLNPGTTYYWKVRARDSKGAIGDWSKVFSLTTSANAK